MSTTAGAGRKKSGYTFLWILIGITIGLAIVAKAVEQMQGACGVESEVGQGSRFWIELAGA